MEEHTVWERFACSQLAESRAVSARAGLFQAGAHHRFKFHCQTLLVWKSSGQDVGTVASIFLTCCFCSYSCTCWWKINQTLPHNACEEGACFVKNGAGSNAWTNAIGTAFGREQTVICLTIYFTLLPCVFLSDQCIALKSDVWVFSH